MAHTIDSIFWQKFVNGDTFVVSELKTGIASAGGTFNVHVENPADSGAKLVPYRVYPALKGESTVRVYQRFDSIAAGTGADIHSSSSDELGGNQTPANAYVDSTFTETNTHAYGVVGSGGAGQNALGGAAPSVDALVEEGNDIVVELTNDSSSTHDGSITVEFFEI